MRSLPRLSIISIVVGLALWVGSNAAKAEVLVESRGNLSVRDAVLEDGSHYDSYPFSGSSGQQVIIYLASQDFDSYLILLDPQGQRIYENDDISRRDSNSRLIVTLPTTGTYTAIANSYEAGKNGRYFIKIELSDAQSSALERMVAAAVPNGAVTCRMALTGTIETLERGRELAVTVSTLPLSNYYKTVPAARPNGLNMSFTDQAAGSLMSSPQLLNDSATELIRNCTGIGAVVFEATEISLQRTFGYLPGSGAELATRRADSLPITEFTCATPPANRRSPTQEIIPWLEWGKQQCL